MSGKGRKKGQNNAARRGNKSPNPKNNETDTPGEDEENGELESGQEEEEASSMGDSDVLLKEMQSVAKELRDFKKDMQAVIVDFKGEIKKDLKEEMATLKHELDQKLTALGTTLETQGQTITEAEKRIAAVEDSGLTTKEAMLALMKEQRRLREKVTDLESRSRRNNIRIYGVREDAEGDSMAVFVERLLTTELPLPDGMSLQIQRAHRALAQKPGPDANPRSIVVNFLQFEVKETILKLAWKKKIQLDNKQIFFDHDYAYEVMEKRRAYGGIKKALKEKGIRFQTPFTRIRIHWSTGPKTYEDAPEATREMRKRGFDLPAPRGDPSSSMEERLMEAFPWQRTDANTGGSRMESRVRDRLQSFRRETSSQ